MDLQNVFALKKAFFSIGTVLLLSIGVSEEFERSCGGSFSFDKEVFFYSLNGVCCGGHSYCKFEKICGGELEKKYCNITDPTVVCPVRDLPWFKCRDKKRCYPRLLRCDGWNHCEDGSDEVGCGAEPLKAQGAISAINHLTSVVEKLRFGPFAKKDIPHLFPHITKTVLALSSTDRRLLEPDTHRYRRDETASELSLQLLTKLTLKKRISAYKLSDYINALIVMCMNPRDFFGFNLVAELRKRVNQSNHTNPFTILTLCNARATMVMEDVIKLQNVFYAHLRTLWTETQALATMALACISSHSSLQIEEKIISEMVKELKRKQLKNGTVESLRTTALVVQALLATNSYQTDFDVHGAVKWMTHMHLPKSINEISVQNLLDIYYILPVLTHMSLVDISSDHCDIVNETDLGKSKKFQDFPVEYIVVQFSFYIGKKKHFVNTWKLKVPITFNLYQILEIVSVLEPNYKVKYITSNEKPYVISVGDITEDSEAGQFWFIYKNPLSTEGNLTVLFKESPVDVPVSATEELILWYRTGDWYSSIDTSD